MSNHPGYATRMVQGAPSIVELARALKNDVDLIYAFVHDHIEFLPTYGSQKGALGCLIDQMGNSFDQSELMIELLREAGYTASYQLGELELTQADATAWLGTETTDIWAARNLLNEGFIPNEVYWTGSEYKLRMTHCFVKVSIGGTDYVFDPAKKTYTTIAGMNLATALSYSQSTFMTNAKSGATINADYVKDINRSNIRDDLDTFTDNLISYINTNNPDASVEEVIGGKTIDPVTSQVRNTSLPYLRPSTTPTTWTGDIPTSYCATLRVLYDSPNIDVTFYSKDIHGKRLTMTFNGSNQCELRLDGTLQATSSAQGTGTWNSVLLEPKHPYATTAADQSFWMTIWAGHPYLIAQAWGNHHARKMIELHQEKLKLNRFNGGADSDEDVIGEAFSVIWHSWNAQNNKAADICNKLSSCRTMYHHQVGLFGHYDTVYEDLPGILWKTAAVDNDWDNVKINDNAMAMHGIAFEAAVLEQVAQAGGASATTIIDIANSAGNKIYDASSSNWSSNVKPNLTNYNSGDLTNVENWWINAGWRVAIPEDGAHTKDDWTGFAYYAISPYQGTIGIIGGSLKGGTGSTAITIGFFDNKAEVGNQDISSEVSDAHINIAGVDLVSGQYSSGAADISIGSGSYPYGLEFARSYRSNQRLNNSGIGLGWSHNHQISVTEFSDGMLALASDNALQGAAGIVELFVAIDLFGDLNKPMDKWVTAAIANQWLTDNATHNAVLVNEVGEQKVFVKSPDGTFMPPPAVKSSLTLSTGLYTLTNEMGVEFDFNSDGKISTIDFPAGPTITYTYTSGKLSTISNGMGRTLTLSYTGDMITGVSDGTGRSIDYTYDSSNNLVTFTDTVNEDTDFDYGSAGLLAKVFRPANPLAPVETNTYDSLNRIKERKDAYNNITKFYLAGPRTEVEDPTAESVVNHINHMGLTTEVIDQLGNSTLSEYDGLGRLTKTTAAEGNLIIYEYDANHNVKKVTAKAKSGSGLSDIVNEFTYDSTWKNNGTCQ